jgi:hypothetical protein
LCRTEDELREAFTQIQAPVVVKACSAFIPHKSDLGLVVLDVRTELDALTAFRRLMAAMETMNVDDRGVLVAKMIKGRREFAVGARMDATFGPVVMVGDGGTYVEALNDFALMLPPFTIDDVYEALGRLRVAPILKGFRGESALNVGPLCRSAVQLGQLMTSVDTIASIDLNPFIVGAEGQSSLIVDALVERR